ncbi:MAG: hypothetical protein ACFCBU_08250 [Cyanophyceae cyanobacterium]
MTLLQALLQAFFLRCKIVPLNPLQTGVTLATEKKFKALANLGLFNKPGHNFRVTCHTFEPDAALNAGLYIAALRLVVAL